MSFRTLKNKFKQPFYKEDLRDVLKNGFITCVLFGVLMGAIQYFFNYTFQFGSSIFMFLIGYFVARKINGSYYSYHIMYQIFAVLFFIIGYGFYSASYDFMLTKSITSIPFGFLSGFISLFLQLSPINIFRVITTLDFNGILNILILIYTIYFTYSRSKNQYY